MSEVERCPMTNALLTYSPHSMCDSIGNGFVSQMNLWAQVRKGRLSTIG